MAHLWMIYLLNMIYLSYIYIYISYIYVYIYISYIIYIIYHIIYIYICIMYIYIYHVYIYIVYIVYSFSSATFPLKSIRFFIPHPPSKLQRSARPDRSPVEEGSKHPGFDVFLMFFDVFLMFFWCVSPVFHGLFRVSSGFFYHPPILLKWPGRILQTLIQPWSPT